MRKSVNKLVLALAAYCCFAAAAQDTPESNRSNPIQFESDSFSVVRPTNTMTFKGFRIDTGRWRLQADEASALADEVDFSRGKWRFSGNIRLTIDTAVITAEQASFTFENQALITAELHGQPVVFEDTAPERDGPVVGRADSIEYDNVAGTVRLLGKVSLSVGPYDTRGCDLIYYLKEEDFTTGSSECDEPFTMSILPSDDDERHTDQQP